MKAIRTLVKEYSLNHDYEYYDIIIESVINGQRKQAKNQFLAMKNENRKDFVKYAKDCVSFSPDELNVFIDLI